jgi:hypothetical protein
VFKTKGGVACAEEIRSNLNRFYCKVFCRGQRIFAPCQPMKVSYGIDMRARIVKIPEYTNKYILLKYKDFIIKH